jgi:hypothetical protein
MTDADLLALCVWDEAADQPYEGKVAVARVVLNRMAALYESDGTPFGTIIGFQRPNGDLVSGQFSGFWFDMAAGKYRRVCFSLAEAQSRAEKLFIQAQTEPLVWADCQRAARDAQAGSGFTGGPQYQALAAEPRTLLYANLSISNPYWALPENRVAVIYAHTFFRA